MFGIVDRKRTGQDKGSYGIIEESKKYDDEYEFEKNNEKMSHHPTGAKVINVTDSGHKILEGHNNSLRSKVRIKIYPCIIFCLLYNIILIHTECNLFDENRLQYQIL